MPQNTTNQSRQELFILNYWAFYGQKKIYPSDTTGDFSNRTRLFLYPLIRQNQKR